MKFEEALKICNLIDGKNKSINQAEKNYVLLKKMEGLGLIKFDKVVNEFRWQCVNVDGYEYLIQNCVFGDKFVIDQNGECIKRKTSNDT